MKWVRLWIVLASVFLAGRLAIGWAVPSSAPVDAAFWARLAVVPAIETAVAGWILTRLARRSGRS
jgi:hypothetical protein